MQINSSTIYAQNTCFWNLFHENLLVAPYRVNVPLIIPHDRFQRSWYMYYICSMVLQSVIPKFYIDPDVYFCWHLKEGKQGEETYEH